MGNRHLEALRVFNPISSPFLHITLNDGKAEYLPFLKKFLIGVGKARLLNGSISPPFDLHWKQEFDFLPDIGFLPPEQIDVDRQTRDFIASIYDSVRMQIRSETNIILLNHYSGLEYLPETYLAAMLANDSFIVNEAFLEIGSLRGKIDFPIGRKRLQTYGVVLEK